VLEDAASVHAITPRSGRASQRALGEFAATSGLLPALATMLSWANRQRGSVSMPMRAKALGRTRIPSERCRTSRRYPLARRAGTTSSQHARSLRAGRPGTRDAAEAFAPRRPVDGPLRERHGPPARPRRAPSGSRGLGVENARSKALIVLVRARPRQGAPRPHRHGRGARDARRRTPTRSLLRCISRVRRHARCFRPRRASRGSLARGHGGPGGNFVQAPATTSISARGRPEDGANRPRPRRSSRAAFPKRARPRVSPDRRCPG